MPPFKSTVRSQREVTKDSTYAGGMFYTDRPIDTGFNKRLVNYVMDSGQQTLLTRHPIKQLRYIPVDTSQTTAMPQGYIPYKLITGLMTTEENPDLIEELQTETMVLFKTRDGDDTLWDIVPHDSTAAGITINEKIKNSDMADFFLVFYTDDPSSTYYSAYTDFPRLSVRVWTPPITKFNNVSFATLTHMKEPLITPAYNGQIYAMGFIPAGSDEGLIPHPDATPEMEARVYLAQAARINVPTPDTALKLPYSPYPSEAANDMFNMLADNPYVFNNDTSETGATLALTGLQMYDYDTNEIMLHGKINKKVKLRAYYKYGGDVYNDYEFLFRWKDETSSEFHNIKQVRSTEGVGGGVRCTFVIPGLRTQVYCTAIDVTNPDKPVYRSDAMLMIDSRPMDTTETIANHILCNAEHLGYWKWRTFVYGVKTAKNAIFFSFFDDPTYYPYPQSFIEFDNPVVRCVNYQNDLLVFTTRQIWRITLNADGMTWTKTLVQGNLAIAEGDSPYIAVCKSFVMFKQQNYFYLVVPYATTASELSFTNISEPIVELLDDLQAFVDETFKDVYGYTGEYQLYKVFPYTVANDIHICMTFAVPEYGEYVNIELIYSTLTRAWMVHVYATPSITIPGVVHSQRYARLYAPVQDVAIQEIHFDEDATDINDAWGQHFPNWQLLDTGYRKLTTEYRKHFREIQYRIRVEEPTTLKFATEIWIDNINVKAADTSYEVFSSPDPNNPNQAILDVTSVYQYDNLYSSFEDMDSIGTYTPTYFEYTIPRVSPHLYWRIRQRGHAKGEAPRLIVRSRNTVKYKFLENYWVYRLHNAR